MLNNVITASRLNTLSRCPRQHYWRYEIGLSRDRNELPLVIGTAWAKALEMYYKGGGYDTCLNAALPPGVTLTDHQAAIVSGLFAGYIERYSSDRYAKKVKGVMLSAEHQFSYALGNGWTVSGKLDLLTAEPATKTVSITESKTTASDISPQSSYWSRLRFNYQVLQYATYVSDTGLFLRKVTYDVTRKPAIKPKAVTKVDANNCKVITDAQGQRVIKKNGKPCLTESKAKGWKAESALETPEQFATRLYDDTKVRPDFYFSRREVPVTMQDLREFRSFRTELIHLIAHFRSRSIYCQNPASAWPRFVSEHTCKYCPFQDFCFQSSVSAINIPDGYSVKPFNPELDNNDTTTEIEADASN